MKPSIALLPGERIIFSSTRGGDAGHSGWWWLLVLFGWTQVCNGLMFTAHFLFDPSVSSFSGALALAIPALLLGMAFFARWLMLRYRPSYFVTSQRIIARRLLLPTVTFPAEDVGAAVRFLINHMRNGALVRRQLTHTMVVALRSGGTRRFGPVKDAESLLALLEGVSQGVIDVRTLPGEGGELSRAETRRDLFFARSTRTAGTVRGPLFVGPTAVIGYASELAPSRMLQLYTIVGAERPAEDIESRMIALAQNTEFGRAVVMPREGKSLLLDGKRLALSDQTTQVAFDLSPADARRAEAQLPRNEHPYR